MLGGGPGRSGTIVAKGPANGRYPKERVEAMTTRYSLIVGLSLGTYLLFVAPAVGVTPWNQWRNALAPNGSPGPELTLADDGKADYVIVIPVAVKTPPTYRHPRPPLMPAE
jgi:hypothetical protein